MPRRDWIWPGRLVWGLHIYLCHFIAASYSHIINALAIALLPTNAFYGPWPRSGDIVIAEVRTKR